MHRSVVARCSACRSSVLDAFASLAGITLPRTTTTTTTATATTRPAPPLRRFVAQRPFAPTRTFATACRTLQQQPQQEEPREPQAQAQAQDSQSSGSVPWYLQVDEPTPPAPLRPTSLALHALPPLPLSPPPILAPMLAHLSSSIGLDSLALLDLRHLSPPPALGANLLMVIGTARSTKHLNVSADRFCRWLRATHGLRPYADGLLGRNELKLKLRRKARRMKMAQRVGNTVAVGGSGEDDGITTGWICVNVGVVPESAPAQEQEDVAVAELEAERQEEPEEGEDEYVNPEFEVVGFGAAETAPRIVVQMFTEEKRAEMNLEGLWDARNTKRAARDRLTEEAVEDHQQQKQKQHVWSPMNAANGSSSSSSSKQRSATAFTGDQARAALEESAVPWTRAGG